MQWFSGDRPVFTGSEHNQITARRKIRRRESPFRKISGVVGQEPAAEVHRAWTAVEQFDPIRARIVFVLEQPVVDGAELIDGHCGIEPQAGHCQEENQDNDGTVRARRIGKAFLRYVTD